MSNPPQHPPAPPSATGSVGVGDGSAEEAFESLITSLALSTALAMPDVERDALFERILSGDGVTIERDGDWVEIHLVGKTIATLDLNRLVQRQPADTP